MNLSFRCLISDWQKEVFFNVFNAIIVLFIVDLRNMSLRKYILKEFPLNVNVYSPDPSMLIHHVGDM